jgi:hypothetical protein
VLVDLQDPPATFIKYGRDVAAVWVVTSIVS